MKKHDRTARRSPPRSTTPRALPEAALSQAKGAATYHDMLTEPDSGEDPDSYHDM